MDFTPLIAQLCQQFAWTVAFFLLLGLLRSPRAKGQIGEQLVRLFAFLQLDKRSYRRLHSVITLVGGSTFKTAMPANVTQGSRGSECAGCT